MNWSEVTFGKHKGKTLPQILCSDPDWFFWAIEKNAFRDKGQLPSEAIDLYYKARHIKIPNNSNGDLVVEYFTHPPTKKFAYFKIVPIDRPAHTGGSPAFRTSMIDMSIPRHIGGYDKLGSKNFIKSLKIHVFGSVSFRFSKIICEGFFSDPSHFAL